MLRFQVGDIITNISVKDDAIFIVKAIEEDKYRLENDWVLYFTDEEKFGLSRSAEERAIKKMKEEIGI